MCYLIDCGVRGYAKRGERCPVRETVVVFLMPIPGSPGVGTLEDNKLAIDSANAPLSSSNTKQIAVKYHFRLELTRTEDL